MRMKERLAPLTAWLKNMATTALLVSVYFVVGLVMAAPYAYLAGWNYDVLFLASWFLPVVSVSLYALWIVPGIMPKRDQRMIPWWIHRVFWGILGYVCLPIFMNGFSILLKWTGFMTVGRYVFEYRYWSFVAVPMIVLLSFVAYRYARRMVKSWYQRSSGGATPPSEPPGDISEVIPRTDMRDRKRPDSGRYQLVPT